MTDTPLTPPGVDRRRWKRAISLEDVILYAFGAVILLIFWVMFSSVQVSERAPSQITAEMMKAWVPVQDDPLELAHMKAQLANAAMRYEQAMRTSAVISTRHDFGFLVGAILALLGAIIAIRGSRGETINAEYAKAKIVTTSSGAFIAFLGSMIILAAVMSNDHAEVTDGGITLVVPGQQYETTQTDTSVEANAAADAVHATRPNV